MTPPLDIAPGSWVPRPARAAPAPPRPPAAPDLEALRARYRGSSAEALLAGVIRTEFPGEIAVLSSFGAEAALTLDLVAEIDPSVPVLFLDTLRHFDETLAYRDQLTARLGLRDVRVVRPGPMAAEDGDGRLFARDPDRCCELRKVQPLAGAARPFRALITGRKRLHGGLRGGLGRITLEAQGVRINPLADWTAEAVAERFAARGLPLHPLAAYGYGSVGCWPCTEPSPGGPGDRSGRWAGRAKTECGIHRPATPEAV